MRCHGIHSLGTRLSPYLLDGRLNEGQASSPVQEDTDTYPLSGTLHFGPVLELAFRNSAENWHFWFSERSRPKEVVVGCSIAGVRRSLAR